MGVGRDQGELRLDGDELLCQVDDLDGEFRCHDGELVNVLCGLKVSSGDVKNINGFAALLEEEEAAEISKHPEVASVFLNEGKKLHTTHSWDFLRLERNGAIPSSSAWKKARFGQDTIIANLDTGVWPESKSFSDKGYGPNPSRWKGTCQVKNTTEAFCNRKLIGARYFNKGLAASVGKPLNSSFETPRDVNGHATHTLSTAAGDFVPGANVLGMGNGTAKGGSPRARAVAYKVCWQYDGERECLDADILKALEMAIHDGVDVVSMSLGGAPRDYLGTSISKPFVNASFHPLISGANARSANETTQDAILCKEKTLDPKKVKGKIVVCLRGGNSTRNSRVGKGVEAARAGAAGMILANDKADGNEITSDAHVLPATHISYKDGLTLQHYINSTNTHTLIIILFSEIQKVRSQVLRQFSTLSHLHSWHISLPEVPMQSPLKFLSVQTFLGRTNKTSVQSLPERREYIIMKGFVQPDITAPGVRIVAAYSEGVSMTGVASDERITPYHAFSGTSISFPHVSGVAGLLKTLHPDWSPAAIKSAIMTTTRSRDNTVHPIRDSDNTTADPFSYGSGHIRPNRAVDPGLVYDLSINDYLDFLCGIGYSQASIRKISGSGYKCPGKKYFLCPPINISYYYIGTSTYKCFIFFFDGRKEYNILNFNYPSISVHGATTVTRKIKNVGPPATYKARVRSPFGYSILIEPSVLKFEKTKEEKSFKVSIKAWRSTDKKEYKYGHFTWSDGSHYVRSPVVILPPTRPN
ncbi:hypothetical protein ACS0TY_032194 [Phlomoides rotata]